MSEHTGRWKLWKRRKNIEFDDGERTAEEEAKERLVRKDLGGIEFPEKGERDAKKGNSKTSEEFMIQIIKQLPSYIKIFFIDRSDILWVNVLEILKCIFFRRNILHLELFKVFLYSNDHSMQSQHNYGFHMFFWTVLIKG